MSKFLVADLGGTFLRCALAGPSGSIEGIDRIRLSDDPSARGAMVWTDIVEAIAAYAERQRARLSPTAPIAVSVPGPIVAGRLTTAPTVLGSDAQPPDIGRALADRTARQVVLLNDVSAAAWYFSERIAVQRFVVVTISSGIGAKVFDRRHPLGVLDDVPSAGEIGHLVVDGAGDAPACDCGGRGHLAAIASARGFERGARRAAAADVAGFRRSANATTFGATLERLTNEAHLVPSLRLGDPWTTTLLQSAIRPLAAVLRSICVGSGLDAIALMGGFAQTLGEPYRALIETAVGNCSDRGPACIPLRGAVVLAGPDEDPSLAGAATFMRLRMPAHAT